MFSPYLFCSAYLGWVGFDLLGNNNNIVGENALLSTVNAVGCVKNELFTHAHFSYFGVSLLLKLTMLVK